MRPKGKAAEGKSGLIYADPYLNLVRGIFERMMNDLVIESDKGSLKKARDDAFGFFFDRGSPYYRDFRNWCDLTGFSHIFWQQKAMMCVAWKLRSCPYFMIIVKKYLKDKAVLAKIKTLTQMLRKKSCWDIY